MHELGLIYQALAAVDEVVDEQSLSDVEEIALNVGEMTDIVPEYLFSAWESAKGFTRYPGARLTVNTIPAKGQCVDCGFTDSVKAFSTCCPVCKSGNLKIISGREFEIKHIRAK